MTSSWYLKRLNKDENFPLEFGNTTIGRDKGNTMIISSVYASRSHCTINVEGNSIKVTNFGVSKTKTVFL